MNRFLKWIALIGLFAVLSFAILSCNNDSGESTPKYVVSYSNATGIGGGSLNLPAPDLFEQGVVFTEDMLPNLEVEGYTFEGWYSSSTFEEDTKVNVGDAIKGKITLYANLVPITYVIKFDLNNGEHKGKDDVNIPTEIKVKYGEEIKLPVNVFSLPESNVTSNLWNTKGDGTGEDFEGGNTVKNLTTENGGVVTLYVKFNIANVTFKAEHGKIYFPDEQDKKTEGEISKKFGQDAYLTSDKLPILDVVGYHFGGWYAEEKIEGSEETEKVSAKNYQIQKDIVFTAKLTPYTLNIQFDANVSKVNNANVFRKGGGELTFTKSFTYGVEDSIPDCPYYCDKGYYFNKWNADENGQDDKKDYLAGASFTWEDPDPTDGEIWVLYAGWATKRNLIYDVQLPTVGNSDLSLSSKTVDGKIVLEANQDLNPSIDDSKYKWYIDGEIVKNANGDDISGSRFVLQDTFVRLGTSSGLRTVMVVADIDGKKYSATANVKVE